MSRITRIGRTCRRSLLVACTMLTFSGCVVPKVVDFKSFQPRNFQARSKPAELQEKSATDLLGGGYLLLGYIDLRRNIQTCYEDATCTQYPGELPSTSELQQEAAKRGGDVVTVLDDRVVIETNDRSECTQFSTQTTRVKSGKNTVPIVTVTCSTYKSVPGKLEARIRRALIWRYDPAAAESEANYQAIDAALEKLDAVASEPAATDATATGLGSLLKGRSKQAVDPAQAKDALQRRIYKAIANNDRQEFEALAREGTLQSWTNEKGRSMLMVALSAGAIDAARTLFAIQPDLNRRDNEGRSALHYAAGLADQPFVAALREGGYDLRERSRDGTPPLIYAILNADQSVYAWMREQGVEPQEADSSGAILLAAEVGRIDVLQSLFGKRFGVNTSYERGETALMMAARGGQLAAAQWLIQAGAKIEATDREGRTVLHYASVSDNEELLRWLLDRGLEANAEDSQGHTPLVESVVSKSWRAAEFLLDNGAATATTRVTFGRLAGELMRENQAGLLRRFLASRPEARDQVKTDTDWMQYACEKSGAETIQLLVELGASPDAPGSRGVPPLMIAVNADNARAVRGLLQSHADATIRDARNRTPLQVAVYNARTEVVSTMRELGVRE